MFDRANFRGYCIVYGPLHCKALYYSNNRRWGTSWTSLALWRARPSPPRGKQVGRGAAPRIGDKHRLEAEPHDAARLLGHHDLDELLVVDLAVAVNVGLAEHLVDLLVGQLLA